MRSFLERVALACALAASTAARADAPALVVDERCPEPFARALLALAPLEPAFRAPRASGERPVAVRCDGGDVDLLVGGGALALASDGPLDEARARLVVTVAAEAMVALGRAEPPRPPTLLAGPVVAADVAAPAPAAQSLLVEPIVPPFAFQLRKTPQPVSFGAMARFGALTLRDSFTWAAGGRLSVPLTEQLWLGFDLAYEETSSGASARASNGVRSRGVSGELALDHRLPFGARWMLTSRLGLRGGVAKLSGVERYDGDVINDDSLYAGPVVELRGDRWLSSSFQLGLGIGAGRLLDISSASGGWVEGTWIGSSVSLQWGRRP